MITLRMSGTTKPAAKGTVSQPNECIAIIYTFARVYVCRYVKNGKRREKIVCKRFDPKKKKTIQRRRVE